MRLLPADLSVYLKTDIHVATITVNLAARLSRIFAHLGQNSEEWLICNVFPIKHLCLSHIT